MASGGNMSRRKGVAAEREVAALFQAAGFTIRGLEAAGDHLCVLGNGLVIHSEVKRHERVRVPEWLRQARRDAPQGTIPVVVFRQSRGKWTAALELEDLLGLLLAGEGDDAAAIDELRENVPPRSKPLYRENSSG